MKAYWIALYTKIENQENLKRYSDTVRPIFEKYGAIPVVRGGKFKVFSGDKFVRTVIWEFPSFEQAIKCHDSSEYQNGWLLTNKTTTRHLQIIESFNIE